MLQPRKAVQRLKKYRPPLEGRAGKLRLDFNENTVGCAPGVIPALRRLLTAEELSRYPEYQRSREKLARYFGVAPEEMLLTNGTDEAIKMLCDAFVDPGDRLVVPVPTFPVFQFFHSVAGGRTVSVRFEEGFRPPIAKLLAAAKQRPRWMAIANPNNPTGTMMPKRDLAALLKAAPRTLVLVDEAYFDFSGETVLPWIRRYANLVVTRTFSKAFGMAALRMGFLFANRRLAEMIHRSQNPFAVNSLAIACACEAIRHPGYVRRYAEEVRSNRAIFCRALDALGVAYVPSAANFVLTRVGEHAPQVAARLRRKRILVRDWSYDPRLSGYVRFSVGTTSQTRRLIRELGRLKPLLESRPAPAAWRNFVAYSPTGWFA